MCETNEEPARAFVYGKPAPSASITDSMDRLRIVLYDPLQDIIWLDMLQRGYLEVLSAGQLEPLKWCKHWSTVETSGSGL